MARAWRRAAPPAEDPAVRSRSGIELLDVGHTYGDRVVLREVSLVLPEHRIAVIGSNGSGKSTLARLLNGPGTTGRQEDTVALTIRGPAS
ncbi:ATP-binding cassette domain-containing protein [Modestobacter excelsi]|uniref:ATP-binding cassette domain-containing protein n=1 Tax=Modestobacter excelsi TaxID=2213161 RepID=UPI001C20E7B0|nr:ATP-binding cassette domain-containing protein [Modestobacter excelsi]